MFGQPVLKSRRVLERDDLHPVELRHAGKASPATPWWTFPVTALLLRDMTLVTQANAGETEASRRASAGYVRTMSISESDTVGVAGHAVSPLNH
ncbi:hypothetical protein GCM10010415_65660 [Streptomyces atrovirens]